MASLSTSANGTKRVLANVDGTRRTIHLGALELRQAQTVRNYVTRLETARRTGIPLEADVVLWLDRLCDELHEKLVRVGLAKAREKAMLGSFIDRIIDQRKMKPNTERNYRTTKKRLVEYFGEAANLRDINAGMAAEWRQSMLNDGLGPATVSREVKRARQFFGRAVDLKIVSANPFAKIKTPAQVNSTREYFVTRLETEAVVEACPDAEWRLIVALCRYGGLRCPSEVLALTWNDIQWDKSRMVVPSPKTAHHEGGASRVVPIFPELRPHLDEAHELAKPGSTYVITRYRQKNANLRTQLERIIRRAGLSGWPKLFHALRASRQTELCQEYPLHVVCKWIGNSEPVATKHYLQVTEEHFSQAVGSTPEPTTRNPTRATLAHGTHGTPKKAETPVFAGKNEGVLYCTGVPVPPRGVEPLSSD